MRPAKLEGRQIGRSRLDINREQVVVDRRAGLSLTQVAKKHSISRASVCRLMKEANGNSRAVVVASDGDLAGTICNTVVISFSASKSTWASKHHGRQRYSRTKQEHLD
jgi:hypothetical protein